MPRKRFQQRNVKRLVQKMIASNIETKQKTGSYDETAVDNSAGTPISANFTNIDQGDGQNNRSGNQVTVTGLYARFIVTGADSTNKVRIVIYMPKDSDDTLSGVDIHTNIDLDKYTILYDNVCLTTSNGDNNKLCLFKKSFHSGVRKGIRVIWHSATGTDVAKNAIKMYVVSDSDAASDPTFTGGYRMYYKDA